MHHRLQGEDDTSLQEAYPRGGFGAAVAASLVEASSRRDPLAPVSVNLTSKHGSVPLSIKPSSDKFNLPTESLQSRVRDKSDEWIKR